MCISLLSKPILLVTCRVGSEKWCIEEIGNVIFSIDPYVEIVKTKYPGLIIVYSNMDYRVVYERVLESEYGFVERIIPIELYGSFNMEFFSEITKLVSPGERIKLKLRIRGKRGYSNIVWKKLIKTLSEKNVFHNKSSEICIYVEVIDDTVYMGRGFC